jgi:hypothetical protein
LRFPASYDRTAKIISGVVCLVLLVIVAVVPNILIACLSLLVLAISLACAPRGYAIEGRKILVTRFAGTVRIRLDDVRAARKATPDDLRGCIRLWGSGGLFGYYGLFSTAQLGKSTWYVTNRSNSVIVITGAKTVLFSPDDPDAFLAAVQAVAPIPESDAGLAFESPKSVSTGRVMVAAAVLAAIALSLFVFTYAPGVPSYTLTAEALTIHDRFYPVTLRASDVDIQQIRILDLRQNAEWRPIARTNGFAVPHYRSGWFRVASGQKVRLYRADSQRVVLLPPRGEGTPVLYQAAHPEQFIEEIRAAWSPSTRGSTRSGANAGK